MRAALALALALAACDDRAASSAAQEGAAGSASGAWLETCEPHPNGAPCCPQDYRPAPEDCPEGSALRTDDGGQNVNVQCATEQGGVPGAPYAIWNKSTGHMVTFQRAGDGFATMCWYTTGYQRARYYDPGEPGADCVRDCYREDGTAAACDGTQETYPVRPCPTM